MDAKQIAADLESEYMAVANGDKKPAKIALEPMVRAVEELRRLAALPSDAAQAPLTNDQRNVIIDLINLAREAYNALDDSEEREGDDGREHVVNSVCFDFVCNALERLEQLPDDKPGETLAAAGKAEWALRHLLAAPVAPAAAAPSEDAYVAQRMSETLAEVWATIMGDDAQPEDESLNAVERVKKAAQVLRLEVDLYRAQREEVAAPIPLLAADHRGIRVDYSGMLGGAQRAMTRGYQETGLAEMLRQFKEHLTELGKRWYAGDTSVVDELLQLYCIEKDARDALVAASGAAQ
ncbi:MULTISPECIES: hypothetical protein [unclassified Paraburkholderia]|uniref:hypothetical protein n=1 Tax=unclassified Paraburkholderia TaxID=2615204 RepID=UPI002AB15D7D|nr:MULTISPECIES: hypothetical protein [unclassified Paraburkholderia]